MLTGILAASHSGVGLHENNIIYVFQYHTDMKPIKVTTCEASAESLNSPALAPSIPGELDLFPFHDPFELRRAVVPVFMNNSNGQQVQGMGTAFHVDSFGTFLTADHVIEPVRQHLQNKPGATEMNFSYGPHDVYPFLLYGIGFVYGSVGVPDEAIAVVGSMNTLIKKDDNPLRALQGKKRLDAAVDIAVMRPASCVPQHLSRSVPLRLSGWRPQINDFVVALGYPELECQHIDEEKMHYLLSEGMHAAYGKIVEIHEKGRSDNDPTPILQIEANWPGGMSGGPVFNESGEIIGIVSKSFEHTAKEDGIGAAILLEYLPWLAECIPTVSADNPGWRNGWAVLRNEPWKLFGFYEKEVDAVAHLNHLTPDCHVAFGSNQIGTDNFIHST